MRRRWLIAAAIWIAAALPSAARANIVMIGDSNFWGVGAGGGTRGVAFQLQRELKEFNVFNYSAPGASIGSMLAPSAHSATYFAGVGGQLRLAIVALGINDWRLNVPLDYFAIKYEEFVADLRQRVPKVACVSPLWSDRDPIQNASGALIAEYRRAIRRVCRNKPGVYFWDAFPVIPPSRHFFVDGLHLNRHGHRRYAKWLRDRVRETLLRPAAAAATKRAAQQKPANGAH
jgi:lysophospholipase L1-like esterase